MKPMRTWLAAVIFACFVITPAGAADAAPGARNIIFMVPDGMGLTCVTAARSFKNGPDGGPLGFETLPHIGYQRTHSADSTVTDSAAAASAWATGRKYNNGEISCADSDGDGRCDTAPPTILELAKARGKLAGLVATAQISHATPGAFGAHVRSRRCGAEIARQFITASRVDVVLGGGVYKTAPHCAVYPESFAPADKRRYIIDLAQANGYAVVTDAAGLDQAVMKGDRKLLGLFEQNGPGAGKTPERFRVDRRIPYPAGEPTLAEMTRAALGILEDGDAGFFLLVEGSQIDWAGHANDLDYLLAETLAFDAAVGVVTRWIAAAPGRFDDTLLIVVADHETGGLAIDGPSGGLSRQGERIRAGWHSKKHTAQDTIIWSQGPGSAQLNRALDNTDLYRVMAAVLD